MHAIFSYLKTPFLAARFVDPANSNNVLSDDLTQAAKQKISNAATIALLAPYWEEIIR